MVLSAFYPSTVNISHLAIRKTIKAGSFFKSGVSDKYTLSSLFTDFSIGEFSIPELRMYWQDVSLEPIPAQTTDGLLGYNFFDNQVILIDYPDRILRIYKGESHKILFSENLEKTSNAIVKFDVSTQTPPKEKSFVTTEEILIDGRKAKVLISINEVLSESYSDDSKKYNVNKNIKIGNIEAKNFPIIKCDSKKYEYILGVNFLQNFVVTFNFKNNRIKFEKKS